MVNSLWIMWMFLLFLLAFMILVILTKALVIYKRLKKETFAVMLSKDKRTEKVYSINPNKEFFKHKTGAYLIREPYVQWGFKRFLFYVIGQPEPVNVVDTKKSGVPSDVFEAIIENEVIKALNRGSGLGAWLKLNMKTVLIIIGGLIVVYYFLSGGSLT